MTTKRILALLIAVLMLVSLFSACASNETKEPDSGSNGAGDDANTPDDTKTPSDDGGEEDDNTPIEKRAL